MEGCGQQHKVQQETGHWWHTPASHTRVSSFFVNDLEEWPREFTLSSIAGDTKLGGAIGALGGCAANQRDRHRLEKWAGGTLMRFNKGMSPGSGEE